MYHRFKLTWGVTPAVPTYNAMATSRMLMVINGMLRPHWIPTFHNRLFAMIIFRADRFRVAISPFWANGWRSGSLINQVRCYARGSCDILPASCFPHLFILIFFPTFLFVEIASRQFSAGYKTMFIFKSL